MIFNDMFDLYTKYIISGRRDALVVIGQPTVAEMHTLVKKSRMWAVPPEILRGLEIIASENSLDLDRELPIVYQKALSPWIGHLRDSAVNLSRDFRFMNGNGARKLGCKQLPKAVFPHDLAALEESQNELWELHQQDGLRNYNTNLPVQLQASVFYWMELRR